MKKLIMMTALALALSTATAMAAVKTYQVTGPVVEVKKDSIVVMKGTEKWEISKGTTDIPATVKAGDKVTIEYAMTATKLTTK